MREEKFKIIQFIREFIVMIEVELKNFPKKDIELKNHIRTDIYELLEISYFANTTLDINNKKRLIEQLIAKVKVIDFLLNYAFENELINKKKYIKFGAKLDDIVKYSTGWLNALTGGKRRDLQANLQEFADKPINQGSVDWLGEANNANNLWNVNTDGNINNNNNNTNGVRPVASKKLWLS